MENQSEFFTEEQLQTIKEESIPLPLFFCKNNDSERVMHVIAITDLGDIGVMGIPSYIELEKYNPNGVITTARYVLTDSYKAKEESFFQHPEDN